MRNDEDAARKGRYTGKQIADRQNTQLIGIAQGLIADDRLNDGEIHFLRKWLVANEHEDSSGIFLDIFNRVEAIFEDNIIDEDEREELQSTLVSLTASDFELGEVSKSSSFPLCTPYPDISFEGRHFVCTGTFATGRRKDCEALILERGGTVGSTPVLKTNFLVIGEYATEAWIQESFGRKIEKAIDLREKGLPISIVSEKHWRSCL